MAKKKRGAHNRKRSQDHGIATLNAAEIAVHEALYGFFRALYTDQTPYIAANHPEIHYSTVPNPPFTLLINGDSFYRFDPLDCACREIKNEPSFAKLSEKTHQSLELLRDFVYKVATTNTECSFVSHPVYCGSIDGVVGMRMDLDALMSFLSRQGRYQDILSNNYVSLDFISEQVKLIQQKIAGISLNEISSSVLKENMDQIANLRFNESKADYIVQTLFSQFMNICRWVVRTPIIALPFLRMVNTLLSSNSLYPMAPLERTIAMLIGSRIFASCNIFSYLGMIEAGGWIVALTDKSQNEAQTGLFNTYSPFDILLIFWAFFLTERIRDLPGEQFNIRGVIITSDDPAVADIYENRFRSILSDSPEMITLFASHHHTLKALLEAEGYHATIQVRENLLYVDLSIIQSQTRQIRPV